MKVKACMHMSQPKAMATRAGRARTSERAARLDRSTRPWLTAPPAKLTAVSDWMRGWPASSAEIETRTGAIDAAPNGSFDSPCASTPGERPVAYRASASGRVGESKKPAPGVCVYATSQTPLRSLDRAGTAVGVSADSDRTSSLTSCCCVDDGGTSDRSSLTSESKLCLSALIASESAGASSAAAIMGRRGVAPIHVHPVDVGGATKEAAAQEKATSIKPG